MRCAITETRLHDVEQLVARQRDDVLELLGQQLLDVRELAVDATRRQHGVVGPERNLVLLHAELELRRARRRCARAP